MNSETASMKEEMYWLVAHIAAAASNPSLMVPSLIEFIRKYLIVATSDIYVYATSYRRQPEKAITVT